jgi:hypothetical protein
MLFSGHFDRSSGLVVKLSETSSEEPMAKLPSLWPRRKQALVQDSPPNLFAAYAPTESDTELNASFEALRQAIYGELDRGAAGRGTIVFREHGKLATESQNVRPYFFVQAQGEDGWLFERSGSGWIISRAAKIASQELFIRRAPVDIVAVYRHPERDVTRVVSPLFGEALLPQLVYQEKLWPFLAL